MQSPSSDIKHSDGGRGAATREKLLRAGLELFGRRDFDDVTTRQLATAAGVNLAAIPYHYGSKENIYIAVAEHIVKSIRPQTYEAMAQAQAQAFAGAKSPAGERLMQVLERLILAFTHEVIGVADAALRAGFILREQFRPGRAFDVLYDGFMRDLHCAMTVLHARLLDADPQDPEMLLRAQCLIGQILGFRMGHEVLRRRLGGQATDPGTIAAFVARQHIAALRREIGATGGQA